MANEPKHRTWCPECGPRVKTDTDGTCAHCGATAMGPGAKQALAFEAENERLRAALHVGSGWHIEFWEAVNAFADAGRTVYGNTRRMDAVTRVEHLLCALLSDATDETAGLPTCANCGRAEEFRQACIPGEDGEWFCCIWCVDWHEEHGCPREHVGWVEEMQQRYLLRVEATKGPITLCDLPVGGSTCCQPQNHAPPCVPDLKIKADPDWEDEACNRCGGKVEGPRHVCEPREGGPEYEI